ncbi:MAG: hypothetical protein SGI97_08865 [candidate division Zixibacteria bacterium]|nr:hypothetical protein [candidate division Zixibacteria bacterium]
MTILGKINQVIFLFVETFRQFKQGRIWLVLLSYYILLALLLLAHYDFMSPLFSGIMSAWFSVFGPERATFYTHYPTQFILLPEFFGWAKFILGFLFEGFALGVIAIVFGRVYFGTKGQQSPIKSTLPFMVQLMIVWLVINGLTLLSGVFLPKWFAPLLDGPRRIMAFNFVLLPSAYILILSPLFFALPSVVIFKENALKAIVRSLKIFASRPLTCIILSALILAGPALVSATAGYSPQLIQRFKPELVAGVLALGLLIELFASFFWMSTAAKFLSEKER